MKDTIYSREQYLRKRAAEKEALNIQLTNNYAFRKLFKMNYIARGFLIALLGLDEEDIVKLEVIDPFEEGENEKEKEGILDIKIYLNNKKKINIEIQNRYQEEYCSKFQFHVVQLKQIESATEEEKQTAKDWQQVEEIIRGNPYREAVKQEMYKMSRDEKERYLYLREEMAVSDEVSRMRTAIKEGIKEGEKRGIKLTKKVFQLSQKGCTIAQIAEKCNIEESEVKEILE